MSSVWPPAGQLRSMLFFFIQAEYGIRVHCVTGVQTCALPIFETSRAMWNYHTLAFAIREGTRYAAVHGSGCSADPRNSCQATVAQVAQRIQDAGIGLEATQLDLTFTSSGNTIKCTLNACLTTATHWPEAPKNTPGNAIAIRGSLPFESALAMFWPGAGKGVTLPTAYLTA